MSDNLRSLARVEYGASPKEIRAIDSTPFSIYGTGGFLGYAVKPLFNGPLVVVARKGTLDNPVFVQDDCWIIDTAYAVLPNAEVDAKWLYYQLSNYDLKKLNESTGVPSISRDYLYRIAFDKATFAEQRKIAKILSTVDAVIEKTKAAIVKYKAIKQGMMHDFFTRGLYEKGHLRPTYEQAPELYKPSELGWVPKAWEIDVWVNACQKVSVGIATSTTKYFTSRGVPLIRNQNIRENNIDASDLLHISHHFAEMNKSKSLQEGDILTIRTGYPGLSAVATDKHSGWQTFTTLISRPKLEFNSYFLMHFLNSHIGRNQIVALQGGGAQQNLNVRWLNKIKVIVLPREEQDAIAVRIKSIYRQIDKEREYLDKILEFKQGIMQALLTGKKRVKVEEAINA